MKLRCLDDLFLAGVREMYDCERRLVEAFPDLVEQATSADLKRFLVHQLDTTREQVARLDAVCARRGTTPRGWRCEAIPMLLDGDGKVEMEGGPVLQDAVVVATCQKILHFMIAAYRSAHSRARHLADCEGAKLLERSLREKEQADQQVTELGERLHQSTATER
jgi:ferritin-like metal-binding protein YciE